MKESPWLPVIIPAVVFGLVAVILTGVGMALYLLAVATGDWFHAPYPHSMMVIIVALILSGLIALGCWLYSRPPGGQRA